MNAALRPVHPAQYLLLAVLGTFLLYLAGSIAARSHGRKSIVAAPESAAAGASLFADLEAPGTEGTKLKFQDFHRVEVKNGLPVWEIKAKDASYYASDALSHVNDAAVIVYRGNRAGVRIAAKAAKLHTDGEQLQKAELEGNVEVDLDDSLHITTDHAVYDEQVRKIYSPSEVEIKGSGFRVKGRGLTLDVDEQIVELSNRVYSYFEPSAQVPRAASIGKLLGQR